MKTLKTILLLLIIPSASSFADGVYCGQLTKLNGNIDSAGRLSATLKTSTGETGFSVASNSAAASLVSAAFIANYEVCFTPNGGYSPTVEIKR